MAEPSVIQIISAPGIKRDGTMLTGDNHVDGQWCRWDHGMARKMGGYRAINKYLQAIARTLSGYTRDDLTYVHAGSAARLERFTVDENGNTSVIANRTPGALTASTSNLWQFDTLTLGATGVNRILAQVAPNLASVSASGAGQLFVGDLFATAALTQVVTVPASWDPNGGVVALGPYAFVFGDNGWIGWCVPGNPSDFTGAGAGSAYITGQKLVRGLPFRGGPGNSPSGLFWSADSLLRASYIGGTPIFQFDTISAQTSILGAQTVIEYDGVFYWAGTDRFLMFNGVVREIPNTLNNDWFFSNINMSQRQKCFAFKVPRFGEIWWCFPFGSATECTHAVIYNLRENTWYDTELPNGGRAAAISPGIFRRPMLSGIEEQNYIATAAVVNAGGAGYVVGEVLTVSGGIGTVSVELTVATVAAGAVATVTISNTGNYTTVPASPVATTSNLAGTGATFDMTFIQPYRFWIHETGKNEVVDQDEQPILSYYETGDITLPLMPQGPDKWLDVSVLEPDFVQTGDLQVTVRGRVNARAPEVDSDPMTITEQTTEGVDATEQITRFKTQRRQLRFRFTSNTIDGDFWAGVIVAHVQPADGRLTS